MKKTAGIFLAILLVCIILAGCFGKTEKEDNNTGTEMESLTHQDSSKEQTEETQAEGTESQQENTEGTESQQENTEGTEGQQENTTEATEEQEEATTEEEKEVVLDETKAVKVWTTASSLNFRKAPNTSAQVLKVLAYGTELRKYEESNGWALVKAGDMVGYVSTKYLAKASQKLGKCVIDSYCKATGFKNRGMKTNDTMTGINWSEIPVTIIELGFMSNPEEDKAMQDSTMQNNMVQGIANGLDAYFGF